MTRISAYGYTLEEVNGEIFFSCNYFNDDYEEIIMEKILVDPKYMDEARGIAKKHGFSQMKYREPSILQRQIMDAPAASVTMYWMDKEKGGTRPTQRLLLNYHPPGTDELMELFKLLAKIYAALI